MIRRFGHFAFGYWSGPTRRTAWFLSLGFLICLIANMVVALAVNRWTKDFFDALQLREMSSIVQNIERLGLLAIGVALAAIATIQFRMRLQLGWRMWLTSSLVERWMKISLRPDAAISQLIDNPEARIADDGRLTAELFVDLAGGVINIFLVSSSFILVLWQVGGSMTISGVTVPGYLVWFVIMYSCLTSLGMFMLGRPLVASVEAKAEAEGNFRYALSLAREKSEAESDARDEKNDDRDFRSSLYRLATKWMLVIRGQTKIVLLSSANNLLAPAVPLVLCAPKYLGGEMTLGDLMQAAAAFLQVQVSLNWLADNALSIANWSASAHRVAALDHAIENWALTGEERGLEDIAGGTSADDRTNV